MSPLKHDSRLPDPRFQPSEFVGPALLSRYARSVFAASWFCHQEVFKTIVSE